MYYETSYPSLTAGISQQLPQSRLPGQLNDQTNMVSDLVRGLCRRGGKDFVKVLASTPAQVQWLLTRVGGQDVLLCIDASNEFTPFAAYHPRTGIPITVNQTGAADTYLLDITSNTVFFGASVGDSAVLTNKTILPSIETLTPTVNSKRAGYFYVASGAYSQDYTVKVRDLTTVTTYTASIQTPDGAVASDVTDSTPDKIAEDLVTALVAVLPGAVYSVYRDGAYVFIKATTSEFEVISDTSVIYLQTSNASLIKTANVLPARLPVEGDGYTVRIGNDVSALHFRYNASTRAWLEDAQPDKRQRIKNLGLLLTMSGGTLEVDVLNSRPRAAGDDISNPALACSSLITGVTAFQGRLVLLSDQYVCMSATNDPAAWFRATVTAVLDSDPIEIALTTSYASPYQSGAVFNGNLLILADSHQVQVPGDIAITPSNATMALVSNYGVRSNFEAIPLGRSLMLPTNTASGYVGFVEALPPENLEAMLRATSVTSHIPTLIKGDLRYVSASNTADTVVFGAIDSTNAESARDMYVHQYLWANGEKVHSAWHRWRFAYPVATAYILEDTLYTVTQETAEPVLCKLSLARGRKPEHYLDYARKGAVTNTSGRIGGFTVASLGHPDTSALRAFKVLGDGAYLGETPTISGGFFYTSGTTGDEFIIGQKFESLFSPTPPIIRDRSENFLASEHIPVVRFIMQVVDTGEVKVRVNDRVYDSGIFDAPVIPHSALQTLGDVPLSLTGTVMIPARTEARDTNLQLWTSDYYDFNITNLEYGFKLRLKVRRM